MTGAMEFVWMLVLYPALIGTCIAVPLGLAAMLSVVLMTVCAWSLSWTYGRYAGKTSQSIRPIGVWIGALSGFIWRHKILLIGVLYSAAWSSMVFSPDPDPRPDSDDEVALVCLLPMVLSWIGVVLGIAATLGRAGERRSAIVQEKGD